MADNTKIQQHLRGINYPVEKNDLIQKVRSKGAPDEVVQQIQRLPQQRFQDEQEVMRSFDRL